MKLIWSRYRPGVARRVGRGIALLFHDRGTRRGVSGQQHALAALYHREKPGTHFTGSWVGPRASVDGCIKSRPHRDSIPDRPPRSSVAILTELPGPHYYHITVSFLVLIARIKMTAALQPLPHKPLWRAQEELSSLVIFILFKTTLGVGRLAILPLMNIICVQ